MINRTAPHLPVQNVERATYREILERWARESQGRLRQGRGHRDNAAAVLPDRHGEGLPDPRRHPVLTSAPETFRGLGINQILDRGSRAGPEALG